MPESLMPYAAPPLERQVFCNRTLNLRAIDAIGYDLDYTLVHYRVEDWERAAYEHLRQRLLRAGWPVADLDFDPELVVRGLIIDLELGNVVKANRFGYVKQAFHGTSRMPYDEQRKVYSRIIIDLNEPRWVFLNTLFALSEACMYVQLVDLDDSGKLPKNLGYEALYRQVRRTLDLAHLEGELKAEILANPEQFVELDPETPQVLLDQRRAGKKVLLITNSEWGYAAPIMEYAFDRFLPDGMTWRDLFHVVIVSAGKPGFFERARPLYEVIDQDGLLRPCVKGMHEGGVYVGGDAFKVEEFLGLSGDQILYVGDHIYVDVKLTKSVLRWRTALILREIESELHGMEEQLAQQRDLSAMMAQKEQLEFEGCQLRLAELRLRADGKKKSDHANQVQAAQADIRERVSALDAQISPLARAAASIGNPNWGPLLRAGNDKSHMARQLERYADVYSSRVSNFLFQTPYVYFRSPRGSLPHDPVVIAPGPVD